MMNGTWVLLTAGLAFGITAVSGFWIIPMLRRLKFGQTILDIGPKWHKSKQGTPTMGGLTFVFGIVIAVLVGYAFYRSGQSGEIDSLTNLNRARLFYGILLALGGGFIGFVDDYAKVVHHRNEGLTPRQKLALQLGFGIFYLVMMYLAGERNTAVVLPFLGTLELGWLYYVFAIFAMLALSNAVNITDGIDGLLSSVTFAVAIAYIILTSVLQMWEMNLLAVAMAGGCLGFLVWNFHPAKVFMGDTGSLFLGGLVTALAFGTGLPMFVVLIGGIYVIEVGSVVIQMTYFKLTHGKRIFKMSPIHHHFELSGWSEVKIVAVFTGLTVIFSAIALAGVFLL